MHPREVIRASRKLPLPVGQMPREGLFSVNFVSSVSQDQPSTLLVFPDTVSLQSYTVSQTAKLLSELVDSQSNLYCDPAKKCEEPLER